MGFVSKKIKHWTVINVICKCDCGRQIKCKKNKIACWKTDCWCVYKARNSLYNYPLSREDDISHSKRYEINRRCGKWNKKQKDNCYKWVSVERKSEGDFKKDMYDGFIKHVKIFGIENTTIDRINPNWNYSKENCRRATRQEQWLNKRNNIVVDIDWVKYNTKTFSEKFWVCRQTALAKMKRYLNWEISLIKLVTKG